MSILGCYNRALNHCNGLIVGYVTERNTISSYLEGNIGPHLTTYTVPFCNFKVISIYIYIYSIISLSRYKANERNSAFLHKNNDGEGDNDDGNGGGVDNDDNNKDSDDDNDNDNVDDDERSIHHPIHGLIIYVVKCYFYRIYHILQRMNPWFYI